MLRRAARVIGLSLLTTGVFVNWRGPSGSEPATSQTTSTEMAPAAAIAAVAALLPVSAHPATRTPDAPADASPAVVIPAAELSRVATQIATHSATLEEGDLSSLVLPVRVSIAGTDIDGPVVPTGVDASTGELAVYPDARVVGWYSYGPRPGESGSAVLASHLDWKGRPGVFVHLANVEPGQVVTIAFSDGSARSFRVVAREVIDKGALPTTDVFARTGPPQLRLITCGGSYDRATHHYRSNVVITAVPID